MSLKILARESADEATYWFLTTLTTIKISSSETGGSYALIEQIAPPGDGSPYHVHRNEDEGFYILEGQLEFISDGTRFVRGPGSFVFCPRDIPHGFRIVGDSNARFLVYITPGGFEDFVTIVGEPAPERRLPDPAPPDMDTLMAAAARFQLEILGPLPE